jgi:hypothetical protein
MITRKNFKLTELQFYKLRPKVLTQKIKNESRRDYLKVIPEYRMCSGTTGHFLLNFVTFPHLVIILLAKA